MSDHRPLVIVSLPADTVEEAREMIERARSAGADLAEVRFDRFAPAEIERARDLFPAPLPLVATLRSRIEGGAGPDDPAERAPILDRLAELPFRWIDLEKDRDRESDLHLPPSTGLGRIVSTHRTEPVSAPEWSRWVREAPTGAAVRKVVVPASVGQLFEELLPGLPPPGENTLVVMTTGASGPLFRAFSARLGFPFVYAALPEPRGSAPTPAPVEPSQISVDRLRPFLDAGPEAPLFALAGHPVAHSRSPALHSRWMREGELSGLYVALDFASEEEFVGSLPRLAEWGFRGLNVTHPLKSAALEVATEVGPGAEACGVANCLTLHDGEIAAENTDLVAILRRLEELKETNRWDGRELAILGTGGAARATLVAARTVGARARLYGRRAEPTNALARQFDAEPARSADARPEGLVVHATDVGRTGTGPLELPLRSLVRSTTHVIDWVYLPSDPTVRQTVEAAGATYEDGRRLLVYQAAASFGIWWGDEPDPDEITATLREEGCTA